MTSSPDATVGAAVCGGCGTEILASRLSCPVCHRLVHTRELQDLAAEAEDAERDGRGTDALVAWRRVVDLLPPESRQAKVVTERIAGLSRRMDSGAGASLQPAERQRPAWAKGAGIAGAVGLLLWKLKVVLVLALTKAKLLLAGFGQIETLLSMGATLGLYWAAWGWAFALGLVLSLYVHEMGHVAALRRLGIAAQAPMFVPGFGAFVRMRQRLSSPREEARVGLAGPLWGLAAATACGALAWSTGSSLWAALAQWGARINLFNLIPLRPLDGGRGFVALSPGQAWGVVATIAGTLWLVGEPFLWPVLILAILQALGKRRQGEGDGTAFIEMIVLIVALSALTRLPVRLPSS